jgi:hypothetical protein
MTDKPQAEELEVLARVGKANVSFPLESRQVADTTRLRNSNLRNYSKNGRGITIPVMPELKYVAKRPQRYEELGGKRKQYFIGVLSTT